MGDSMLYTKIASDRVKKASVKMLCQEDFLDRYDNIIDGNKEFEMDQFKDWFKSLDIDYDDKDLSSRESLKEKIKELPETRLEIAETVFCQLKELFSEKNRVFPDAAAYIKRLVQNIGDKDLTSKGSVRLQIVQHFLRYSDSDVKQICDFVLEKYPLPKGGERAEFVIKHIDDEDISFLLNPQKTDPYCKFKCLISALSSENEFTPDEKWNCLEQKIEWNTAHYEKYKECTESSEDTDMMKALIKLEQNIQCKYADIRKHVKYSDIPENTRAFLEEFINDTEKAFKEVTKAKLKKDNSLGALYESKTLYNRKIGDRKTTPNPILLLADDLANGRFKGAGVTREYLYRFAIVFGMTAPLPGKKADEERDLELRLFFDYCGSNSLFFTEPVNDCQNAEEDSRKKSKKSDISNASGEGINWKNFVEVVYLYYITREGLTRKERLSKAEKTINSLKKKDVQRDIRFSTQYYRKEVISGKKFFSLPESELENFIQKHYDLHKYDGKRDTSYIQYSSEQVSAEKAAANLRKNISMYQQNSGIASLKTRNQTIRSLAQQLDNKGYSKEFVDSWEDYILSILPGRKYTDILNDDEKRFIFMNMAETKPFDDIRSFIMEEKDEPFRMSMLQALKFTQSVLEDDNKLPSRNQILALYANEFYCKYVAIASDCGIMDFDLMKSEFEYGANMYLEQCRYQKLSEKNFYDVFLLFALYYISIL